MAFKMDGPSLYKKPVGPRATLKPIDRNKFEQETGVMQGMENVEQELFSSKATHDIVKKNIKNKTNNMKKKNNGSMAKKLKPDGSVSGLTGIGSAAKMKKKSSMAKKKFGPKTMKKPTGKSGSLREVISDTRTKTADVIGKLHKGFDKPLAKNIEGMGKTLDSMTAPANTVQNVGKLGAMGVRLQYGLTPTVFGKLGGQLLENIIRPGKQTQQFATQIGGDLEKARKELKSATKMKRRSDGSIAKLKDQSFMKRMKMMNEASSPMNKENKIEKIPTIGPKPIDMKPSKEAIEGRRMINKEKQDREFKMNLAKKNPDVFFKVYNQSPSEYLSSLPYG